MDGAPVPREYLLGKSGAWAAGDFELITGPATSTGFMDDYETTYGPNFMATLQPNSTIDDGILNVQASNAPQAPLKSGTVTYSSSPAPNGSFQFTLAGGPPNTTFQSVEGNLFTGGSGNYQLYDSSRNAYFTTDAQGNLTFTVLQDGTSGDILDLDPNGNMQGYVGGFWVP